MNLKELSKKYGFTENNLSRNFPACKESIYKKYGIIIEKEGRGISAQYIEIMPETDKRAITLYDEKDSNIALSEELLSLVAWKFIIVLTLMSLPLCLFKGSYIEFLTYLQINTSKTNIEHIKEAFKSLQEKDYIGYYIDKTNAERFIITLLWAKEREFKVQIDMIKRFKAISEAKNKRSWIPLFKTWLAMEYVYKNSGKIFTVFDIEYLTGLNRNQITENRRILESENVIKTEKIYKAFDRCLGRELEMNALYNPNENKEKN